MLRAAALGVWGFVVGDDWRAAVGVVVALAATALAAGAGLAAWWICPLLSLSLLYWSVRRAPSVGGAGPPRRRRTSR